MLLSSNAKLKLKDAVFNADGKLQRTKHVLLSEQKHVLQIKNFLLDESGDVVLRNSNAKQLVYSLRWKITQIDKASS